MEESSEERALLESLRGGDAAAFWKLWRVHRPHLYELCERMAGGDADDAMSRSMMRAYAKLPAYAAEIVNLEAWLTRLACNVCRDIRREQRPCGMAFGDGDSGADALRDPNLTPEQEYVQTEARAKVTAAIGALHPRLRGAACLYFLDDLPYRTIAERLGISTDNARKRIQQARAVLREELRELYE